MDDFTIGRCLTLVLLGFAVGCSPPPKGHCGEDADCGSGQSCVATDCINDATDDDLACDALGHLACRREQALRCDGEIYQPLFRCPPGQLCGLFSTGDAFFCHMRGLDETQQPYAVTGDPCTVESAATCSLDDGFTQSCQLGSWARALPCLGRSCARIPCATSLSGYCVDCWLPDEHPARSCTTTADCCDASSAALCDPTLGLCLDNRFCAADPRCDRERFGICSTPTQAPLTTAESVVTYARSFYPFLGLVVRVSDAEGRMLSEAAAGLISPTGPAVTNATRFRIASLTKLFTAVVVLQLFDEGMVDLDAPATLWVPQLPTDITVRDLLSHRSGLTDYLPELVGRAAEPLSPEQLLDIALATGRAPKPMYSNTNYIALGLLIEAATQMSYRGNLDTRILRPLELTDTYLDDGRSDPLRALGTSWNGNESYASTDGVFHPLNGWSAGGIVSNARDLATLLSAVFSSRVISLTASSEMLAINIARPSHIRLGVFVDEHCGLERQAFHSAEYPMAGFAEFSVMLSDRRSVVVMTNSHFQGGAETIAQLVCQLFRMSP